MRRAFFSGRWRRRVLGARRLSAANHDAQRSNWIYTGPGKHWVAAFRFYAPEPAIHDRSWTMGDIESMK
jgi:hypothetical protein